MYELSRDMYRALKPSVLPDPRNPGRSERVLLMACEATVERIARDLRRYPRPARHLFAQIRFLFPLQDQLRAYRIIEEQVQTALEHLEAEVGPDIAGRASALRCAAVNRKGKPCGREPLRGSRYCPSHKQLEGLMPDRSLYVA